MPTPRIVPVVLLLAVLTACASVQQATDEVGRLTPRPRQLVSKDELRNTCGGIVVTMTTRIDRLRELQGKAKQEEQQPPPSLMAMLQGRPAVTEFEREREHLAQLNAALEAKGCETLNVAEELRRPPPVKDHAVKSLSR